MKIEQVDIVYRYDTDAEPLSFRLEKEKTYFFHFDDEIEKWWCRVGYPDEYFVKLKHGKWDDEGNCSVCGKNVYDDIDADIWSRYVPPFCPNCGAKMDENQIYIERTEK